MVSARRPKIICVGSHHHGFKFARRAARAYAEVSHGVECALKLPASGQEPNGLSGRSGGRTQTVSAMCWAARLRLCSDDPVTGFFRDGCCNTSAEDVGSHTVCAIMTAEFLAFSKARGNDLVDADAGLRLSGSEGRATVGACARRAGRRRSPPARRRRSCCKRRRKARSSTPTLPISRDLRSISIEANGPEADSLPGLTGPGILTSVRALIVAPRTATSKRRQKDEPNQRVNEGQARPHHGRRERPVDRLGHRQAVRTTMGRSLPSPIRATR